MQFIENDSTVKTSSYAPPSRRVVDGCGGVKETKTAKGPQSDRETSLKKTRKKRLKWTTNLAKGGDKLPSEASVTTQALWGGCLGSPAV